MTGPEDLEALREVMPPPRSGGDDLDWNALAEELGVRFPSDYKLFMEAYGGGTIDDTLFVLPLGDIDGWKSEYLNADEYVFDLDIEAQLGVEIPGEDPPEGLLVPWAVAPSGAVGCWFVSGDDPDQWPVVVFRNRSHPTWFRYDGGFVNLLRSVVAGEFGGLFGIRFPMWPSGADYLNARDRELLKQRGVSTRGYLYRSTEIFAQMRAAGIDPEEYFPHAVRHHRRLDRQPDE